MRIGAIFSDGVDWFVVVDIYTRWNFITKSHEGMISVKKNADGAVPVEIPIANLPNKELEIAPCIKSS